MNTTQEIIEVLDKLHKLAAVQNDEINELKREHTKLKNAVHSMAEVLTQEQSLRADYLGGFKKEVA